jgi:hypothetical protein
MSAFLFEEALRLKPDLIAALVGLARTHVLDLLVLSAAAPAANADNKSDIPCQKRQWHADGVADGRHKICCWPVRADQSGIGLAHLPGPLT